MEDEIQPILESYLGRRVTTFINAQAFSDVFAGYDDNFLVLGVEDNYILVSRKRVDMIMPKQTWEAIVSKGDDNV